MESGAFSSPLGPRPSSSGVPGTSSGPGSAIIPSIVVPVTPVVLTVVNVSLSVEPVVTPVPAASRNAPSAAARINDPTTFSVIIDEPGSGFWNNR